jgi:colanic acid biosynthesis glycosyl transferase WcaI
MNITIISNHYYPEDSGIGLYSAGMAEFLAKKHKVKVIAGTPYYPQWKIYPEYQNHRVYSSEIINNVEIFRFKQYTPETPNFLGRIMQMIHFFLGSIVNVFKIKENDMVIVVMPFTISIVLGWFVKIIRGGKLWVHVQDFEFDAAYETGISNKKGLFFKIIFRIERFILNRADFSSTISNGMLKKLTTKTKTESCLFPNWIDHSIINPKISKPISVFDISKFNILYSGNIGAKQDWDLFIDFVEKCHGIQQIKIYLIGEGAKRKEVVERIKPYNNCKYLPPVRYEGLNDLLCNADLHLLFQKDSVLDTVMPSKILGMMASAKPSIVTGHKDSEVKHNFYNSRGGFYFHGDDKMNKIMETVKKIIENSNESISVGENARNFVIEKYSSEKVLSQFQQNIEKYLLLK